MATQLRFRTISALTATAIIAASTAACTTGDDPTGPGESAAGPYNLALVSQGSASCAPVNQTCAIANTGASEISVSSGLLNLSADNSFTLQVSGFENGVTKTLGTVAGTWAQTSTGVSFSVPGITASIPASWTTNVGEELVFTIPGSVVSSNDAAIVVVFAKP